MATLSESTIKWMARNNKRPLKVDEVIIGFKHGDVNVFVGTCIDLKANAFFAKLWGDVEYFVAVGESDVIPNVLRFMPNKPSSETISSLLLHEYQSRNNDLPKIVRWNL